LNFLDRFSKNPQIQNLMHIHPVGAYFHEDGQTDSHDKADSRFSRFYDRAQKWLMLLLPNICAFVGDTVESNETLSYGS
jgi:hypothetical protein